MMKHKKQRRFKLPQLSFRSKVIIGSVGAIILVAVGTLAVLWLYAERESGGDDPYQQILKEAEAEGVLRNQAKAELGKGNKGAAGDVYQRVIDKERDVNKKIKLYIDLANVLYDAKQPFEAIDTAKKAEVLSDDKFLVADWLSRAYEDQRDYESAIKYYQLAGQSVASPQNEYLFEKAYYDAEASRVMQMQRREN